MSDASRGEGLESLERYRNGMDAQLAALDDALEGGMPRAGWKVGINVPEVLEALGLRHPGIGWLSGHDVHRSGDTIRIAADRRLHVEPEVCLRVRDRISPELSPTEALSRVSGAAPALELVDYAKPAGDLDRVVSHSMFHAGLVVGRWQPVELTSGLGRGLPRLSVPGEPVQQPRSDLVPGDLGRLLLFVSEFLAAFGWSLEPGDRVLSGSYTARAVPLSPGSTVDADFGPLGRMTLLVAAD
jgi:2-keto-4-pentenoate hydratase